MTGGREVEERLREIICEHRLVLRLTCISEELVVRACSTGIVPTSEPAIIAEKRPGGMPGLAGLPTYLTLGISARVLATM